MSEDQARMLCDRCGQIVGTWHQRPECDAFYSAAFQSAAVRVGRRPAVEPRGYITEDDAAIDAGFMRPEINQPHESSFSRVAQLDFNEAGPVEKRYSRKALVDAWAEGYLRGTLDNESDLEPAANPYRTEER